MIKPEFDFNSVYDDINYHAKERSMGDYEVTWSDKWNQCHSLIYEYYEIEEDLENHYWIIKGDK